MSWWHKRNDAAASEVVGYILVTGISILTITVVMLQSGPALEEIRSTQQHDAMLGYFNDLDQAVSQILSGAPAGATPVWRVSMASGSIDVDESGHMWVYAVDRGTTGIWYANFADGDNAFDVAVNGTSDKDIHTIEATSWDGATETDLSLASSVSTIPHSGTVEIALQDTGVDHDLAGRTVQVTFYDDAPKKTDPFAEVWFVDAGHVKWERMGAKSQEIRYENGAILSLIDGGQVMHNSPRIQPPEVNSGGSNEHLFVRFIKINGSASLGGQQSAEILVSSQGSHARYTSDNVTRVQLYPPADLSTVWKRKLTNCNLDYSFSWEDDPAGIGATTGPVAYRSETSDECDGSARSSLSTTLVETDIKVTLKGGV